MDVWVGKEKAVSGRRRAGKGTESVISL